MKKTIITIISLLVGLIIVIYAYEFIFKKPIIESPTIDESSFPTQKIEIKEQYKDSTYTFVGSLDLPTPCHSLATTVNKVSDAKYQIQVTTIDPKKDTVCAQVITPKPYKVSFKAQADIEVTVNINGVEYQTNRFVVPDGENIDTFQLEVKG
jgi:hypothetical protein